MINLKHLLLLLFFSLFSIQALGQTKQLESAKLAVDTLFFTDQKKGLKISEENLPIAFTSGDTVYITYFLDQAGELNRKAGNYDKAISQLSQCLEYKKNWKDLKDLSLTHNNLGKTYLNKGIHDLAVFHFIEALKLMEEDNNLMGQGFYLNNLAAAYDLQHNYQVALDYYQQSLEIKKQIGDSTGIAASYTNLGITYKNLGDYENAVSYNNKAYQIYKNLGSVTKVARTLNNLGEAYLSLEQSENAMSYLKKAYSLDSLNEDMHLRISITNNLGHAFYENNQLDSAYILTEKAEKMALKTRAYKNLKEIYGLIATLAEEEENWITATDALKKQLAYKDSLVNEENIYAIVDMQGKYEYEKHLRLINEGELEILQKQNYIEKQKSELIFWISVSVLLIISIIGVVFLYFSKQKNALLLKGQLALLSNSKSKLEELNQSIQDKLDRTKISLEEKEELLEEVFSSVKEKELPPELLSLSKREMEVLSHLALGWTDDQLAEKLFVSKSTIKTHLRRIYSKLLVRGRAEAVSVAHRYNLIGDV
ncbi:tetratricopeptide repeat protein [Parvicella tangerina]|uniref:HTH-type transcriptional regulator MalT n=1 Tax=Parvicella tangerina TaxID=2829795 RepID=A0A916N923_9FLAO|nr:tetratricopeptide repeat protein [Parvicella tangerina]CAG5076316.1 HTH-type transcriptional regulator MalT [Parvicella tangerina]